jgi:hypothetical protein
LQICLFPTYINISIVCLHYGFVPFMGLFAIHLHIPRVGCSCSLSPVQMSKLILNVCHVFRFCLDFWEFMMAIGVCFRHKDWTPGTHPCKFMVEPPMFTMIPDLYHVDPYSPTCRFNTNIILLLWISVFLQVCFLFTEVTSPNGLPILNMFIHPLLCYMCIYIYTCVYIYNYILYISYISTSSHDTTILLLLIHINTYKYTITWTIPLLSCPIIYI